jgi:catechol 2,3-dioxygenase-like lactoylglutathione lyase family enzyme
MERVTGIGGVFIRSAQPDALRAWYAEHLGLRLEDFGGAILHAEGGETLVWSIFPGDTDYFGARTVDCDGNRVELWQPPSGQ